MDLEAVIGLEVHVQLATRTKLFCGDLSVFGAPPNRHTCPVCLGLPGALPVLNVEAVELAVRAALALDCAVHERSVFARKNYFYPDLPKGYQITQYDRPLATGGRLEVPAEGAADGIAGRPVRIRRVHLEEDAGKSLHDRFPGRTAIDLNRAGVPLIEIVTEPDLRSPEAARAWLGGLKRLLEYLEVSDCDMEKGSLRVDANVSLRARGEWRLGTKTEVKNMNSFSNVERALDFELLRQEERLRSGGAVRPETLLWDAERGEARPLRSKEESHDYRYFPEPDLPPLALDPAVVRRAERALPELPAARASRFRDRLGLPEHDAGVLTSSRELADYFEATATASGDAKTTANWIMTEVLAWLNRNGAPIEAFPVPPAGLARLIALIREGTISGTAARRVLARMIETGREPGSIVEEEGLAQVRDVGTIEAWVRKAIDAHPNEAARYRAGEEKLLGFFMGEVMRSSRGRADPRRAAELLRTGLRRA